MGCLQGIGLAGLKVFVGVSLSFVLVLLSCLPLYSLICSFFK